MTKKPHNQGRRKLLSSWVLAPLWAAGASLQAQTPPPAAPSKPILRFGYIDNYPPFSRWDAAQQRMVGFEVELGQALAQAMGCIFKPVPGQLGPLLVQLKNGDLDLIGNQLVNGPDVAGIGMLSRSYAELRLMLAQHEDDNRDFLSLEDFEGLKLGVLEGTPVQEQALGVLSPDSVVTHHNIEQALTALSAKRLDAVLDENLILEHHIFIGNLPLKTTTPMTQALRNGLLLPRNRPRLLSDVNSGIEGLVRSGVLRLLSEPVFGYDIGRPRVSR